MAYGNCSCKANDGTSSCKELNFVIILWAPWYVHYTAVGISLRMWDPSSQLLFLLGFYCSRMDVTHSGVCVCTRVCLHACVFAHTSTEGRRLSREGLLIAPALVVHVLPSWRGEKQQGAFEGLLSTPCFEIPVCPLRSSWDQMPEVALDLVFLLLCALLA